MECVSSGNSTRLGIGRVSETDIQNNSRKTHLSGKESTEHDGREFERVPRQAEREGEGCDFAWRTLEVTCLHNSQHSVTCQMIEEGVGRIHLSSWRSR